METSWEQRTFMVEISGPSFLPNQASLPATLEILQGYKDSLQYALELAAEQRRAEEKTSYRPSILIHSTESNSFDIKTVIDVVVSMTALAPLAPNVLNMLQSGWEIYQKAAQLISYTTDYFKRNNQPVNINIENSPGASPTLIFAGSSIHVTQDILGAARAIHKPLDKMAKQVACNSANRIAISGSIQDEPFVIDETNMHKFNVPEITERDDQPMDITCGLYSINKHTRNGSLEILTEEEDRKLPFSIEGDQDIADYVDGLKATHSTVTAIREVIINALGETKIKKLYISKIENYWE